MVFHQLRPPTYWRILNFTMYLHKVTVSLNEFKKRNRHQNNRFFFRNRSGACRRRQRLQDGSRHADENVQGESLHYESSGCQGDSNPQWQELRPSARDDCRGASHCTSDGKRCGVGPGRLEASGTSSDDLEHLEFNYSNFWIPKNKIRVMAY